MVYENIYKDRLYSVDEIADLKEMLNNCKEKFGKNTAFLQKDRKGGTYKEINYITFKDDVDALGTKLIDMGLLGEKIAIIGENSYPWMVAYFAVVNGAGIVVPLDKELSKPEIENLVKTAKCSAVFYTASYEKVFEDIDVKHKFKMEVYEDNAKDEAYRCDSIDFLINEGRKLLNHGDRRYIDIDLDNEEVRMLLFTSGTTGNPKAVMLCHKNIISNIKDVNRIVKVYETDRMLSILPIHHTFESTIGIMVPLFAGASVAFYEGLKYVSKNLEEARATVLVGVPLIFETMYKKIWKQAEKLGKEKALKKAVGASNAFKKVGINLQKKLFKNIHENFGGRLRLLVTGAAAISPNVVRGFQDFGIGVVMGYGLTETAPLVAGTPDFSDRYIKAGTVGQVVPSGALRIINKDADGMGEIIYKGPNVMLGYYNMPKETDEVLKDGWFYTGDMGFADEQGFIYLSGRKKNVIVTKTGKNIYPEEIEDYLKDITCIKECMVYAASNKETLETIVSVQVVPDYEVIKAQIGEVEQEEIYKYIKDKLADVNAKLPNYKRIRNLVIRKTDFVKTTTQKIKRQDNI
ncbi:MAG: AMP-dependent synthetase/ligase [Eubacteriales bacterium]